MTRNMLAFTAMILLLIVILGGGLWLACAPFQPTVTTTHVTLPDARIPR